MNTVVHVTMVVGNDQSGFISIMWIGLDMLPKLEEYRVVISHGTDMVLPISAMSRVICDAEINEHETRLVIFHHFEQFA